MPLPKLTRPIIFFDLETTGLMVEIDFIIEIGLVKLFPDGQIFRLTQRFDPGIKIPAESSAIHGIYNKDLEGQPRFVDVAEKLFEIFNDADLGGYAIRRLDIPMMVKEFERAGFNFSVEGRRLVDVSVIFREKERRDLTAAYKFYCGKTLVGAHGAEADNDATLEIFQAQLERYPDIPQDVEGLHGFCRSPEPSYVDRDGKLIWRDGEAYFSFGKHRYKALEDVTRNDREYLDWIINRGDFSEDFVNICLQAKRGIFPKKQLSAGHEKGGKVSTSAPPV